MVGFCKSISSYNLRKDKNGNPLIEDCQKYEFYKYYGSPESWTIFRALWTNQYSIQDKYVAYWEEMAKYLAKN